RPGLCNGSTAGFGPVSRGSNPLPGAQVRHRRDQPTGRWWAVSGHGIVEIGPATEAEEHERVTTRPAAVVVLAAGEGTRMRSSIPKVLHELAGRSLVGHAVAAAQELKPDHLSVVIGHGRDLVAAHLDEVAPTASTVVQEEQLGTGHAVGVALEQLPELDGVVVVTYGDVPLLTGQTLHALMDAHVTQGNAVTVLTAKVADPTGYGRIVRGADGEVHAIVEHKDASDDVRAIAEIK